VIETPQTDTLTQATAPPSQPEIKTTEAIDTTTALPQEPSKPAEAPAVQQYDVVKKGVHEDELNVSHYVIVGAFKTRKNAQRYSEQLKEQGYDNSFGYVTGKNVYHVYVFESSDLERTRTVRDQFRKLSDFQFRNSWVLTVQE
jgi:cell division protein FtsN